MQYRREIDGLRAVAVLPVIFFHAGFPLFSGGFVGVDVFFVISGFLITSIIVADLETGKFSIVDFYERRARRILPALFAVAFACIPFAWLWMLPFELKDFSQSLVAVSLFASNFLFWLESGYFEPASEAKPLLHTWSLAVEEQFYLVFPLLLALFWRFGKRNLVVFLLIVVICSLLLSDWASINHTSANFYLSPTRVWELLCGSLASFIVNQKGILKSDTLSFFGLLAIIVSIFFFDDRTPFPSFYALVPVLGTTCILICAAKDTLVARVLSVGPIVGIGLISYSAYLWHQPIFAFARIKLLDHPSDIVMLTLIILTIIFAYLSWRYLETPFRNKAKFNAKQIFTFSFAGLMTLLCIGLLGHFNEGFQNRFSIDPKVYETIRRSDRQDECFGKEVIQKQSLWYCVVGDHKTTATSFIFGDSHALSMLPAFDAAYQKEMRSGVFSGTTGCTPFKGIYPLRTDQKFNDCYKLNQRVFNFIRDSGIKDLILVANWTLYTDGGYMGDQISFIGTKKLEEKSMENSRKAFAKGLKLTIAAYQEIGVSITVISQVPQQMHSPLDIYALSERTNTELHRNSVRRAAHEKLQKFVNDTFSATQINVIDFTNELCGQMYCPVGNDSKSYYYDDDHLSVEGSLRLVDAIRFKL